MPPIPIYTDSPIAASKADGMTPQTAETPSRVGNAAPANGHNSYPAAQPGAAPAPAPTGYIPRPQPEATRTTASSEAQGGPPPPQPGAVPSTPSRTAGSTTYLPPPPQAGTIPSASTTTAPPVTTMPPQMAIPPPSTNLAPTHTTHAGTSLSSTRSGPTTINLGPVPPTSSSQFAVQDQSLQSHPPGYVQNTFAQEMSAAQRASLEAQEAADRPGRSSLSGSLSSILGTDASAGQSDGAEGGVWGAVKGFAAAAGQKAVELEESAWKKVNGK